MFDGDKMGRLAGGVLICVVLLAGTISAKDNPDPAESKPDEKTTAPSVTEVNPNDSVKPKTKTSPTATEQAPKPTVKNKGSNLGPLETLLWSKYKGEMKKKFTITLVKKEWKPVIKKMPDHTDILPKYPGDLKDVQDAFFNEKNDNKNTTKPLEKAVDLLTAEHGYNPQLESIFFIKTLRKGLMIRNTIIALGTRNLLDHYNFFIIDITENSCPMGLTFTLQLFAQKLCYPVMQRVIGSFFDSAIKQNSMRPDQTHFVGYCWGGLVAGYVARYLKDTHKEKAKSVLALDPHSSGLSSISNNVLQGLDAKMVYVFHTNSVFMGTLRRRAGADIVFNGGWTQPGCKLDPGCNHSQAIKYMWYSIIYPDLFVARRCTSWISFKLGKCNEEETISVSFPPVSRSMGVFYISTNAEKPYGLGAAGAQTLSRKEEEKNKKPKRNAFAGKLMAMLFKHK